MSSCALEFQMTRFDRLQNLRRRLITKWPVSRCPTNRLIGYLAAGKTGKPGQLYDLR
jgi:hypothetical protein